MANILRPIPPIAWIPFSLVIFGSGTGAATFIVGIGVFWTTHITTLSGIKNINPNLLELAEIYNLHKPFDLFFKIILPASLPNIIGGVRTALGQGWSLIVAAELLGVPGMGQRMWEAAGVLANDIVFLYMFIIAGAYHLSDLAFTKLEGSLFKWKI
jgi:NitT/TauT family transport system permease protein